MLYVKEWRKNSIWKRKVLRRIYGPKDKNGKLEIIKNCMICTGIRRSLVKWKLPVYGGWGHFEKSKIKMFRPCWKQNDVRSLLNKIGYINGILVEVGALADQRNKWLNNIVEDTRKLGLRTWKRVGLDSSEPLCQ